MKTEQEQIEEMRKIVYKTMHSIRGIASATDIATALVQAGYGDVSEYEAEIERLETTLGQCNAELNGALETLKSQCHEIGKLKAENEKLKSENGFLKYCQCLTHGVDGSNYIKQAQIDALNKVKEHLYAIYITKSAPLGDITVEDIADDIDELIKEVEDAEDKG